MKAVFRVSNRLRAGAPIPRDFLPIPGIEHLGLCFQRKIITDPAEFNSTLEAINDPRFPLRGAVVSPYILTPADEAKLAPDAAPDAFRMDGKSIFLGEDRVAGLFGEGEKQHLRVSAERAELRPEIESWLNSIDLLQTT